MKERTKGNKEKGKMKERNKREKRKQGQKEKINALKKNS